MTLVTALRRVMLNAEVDWYTRGTAARLLALADAKGTFSRLLDLFFAQEEKLELWGTALTLERLGDRGAVQRLIEALQDENPHRRHAASHTLGWIPKAGPQATDALIRVLVDSSQPQPAREEAAESLAYSPYRRVIPPLISVLGESDVRIRFWAVFALGTPRPWHQTDRGDPLVVQALEGMLSDAEVPPGNWWSVGREALAMLGHLDLRYRAQMNAEIQRVMHDPQASPEDQRWAEGYG